MDDEAHIELTRADNDQKVRILRAEVVNAEGEGSVTRVTLTGPDGSALSSPRIIRVKETEFEIKRRLGWI